MGFGVGFEVGFGVGFGLGLGSWEVEVWPSCYVLLNFVIKERACVVRFNANLCAVHGIMNSPQPSNCMRSLVTYNGEPTRTCCILVRIWIPNKQAMILTTLWWLSPFLKNKIWKSKNNANKVILVWLNWFGLKARGTLYLIIVSRSRFCFHWLDVGRI